METPIAGATLGVMIGAIFGNGSRIVGGLIGGVSGFWLCVALAGCIGGLLGEIVRLRKEDR